MEELSDGEIVWVKVSNSWWPGEVMGGERLTEEFLSSLRKRPLAVVKFFQEDTYEYVKNPSFIFKYNCPRKAEFLRKGLEQFRAKKKHMETFPEDVKHAERMTGGDPDIVNSTDFLPQKKQRYSGLFQESSTPTSKVKGNQKGKSTIVPNNTPTTPARKPIHEVRILPQSAERSGITVVNDVKGAETPNASLSESVSSCAGSPSSSQTYRCYKCNYGASRQNLIVLHMKNCRSTGIIGVATPTSTTPADTPIRSIVEAQQTSPSNPLDDPADDDEPESPAVLVSDGRSKRSLTQAKAHQVDLTTLKPTGTRGRGGRTPKQTTTTVSHRHNRRAQLVNQENEELATDDIEDVSFLKSTSQRTEEDKAEQPRRELENELSSKHELGTVEAAGKKNKTDVKLKNELLADWSEDEQEDEDGEKYEAEQKTLEPIAVQQPTNVSSKLIADKTSNEDETEQPELTTKGKALKNAKEGSVKVPFPQNRVSKQEAENDKVSGGEAEEKSTAVDVKERKRSSAHESCPPVVVASVSVNTVSVAAPTTMVLPVISPCNTIKYRNIPKKQKREYIEVTNDDASSVPSREGSTASSSSTTGSNDSLGVATVPPSATSAASTAERPISAKQLILNRATRGSSGDETATVKIDDADPVTVLQQASPDLKTSPSEEASCFDFDDEEEGKQQSGTMQFSSVSPPSRRSGAMLDRKRFDSGRKTNPNEGTVVAVASTENASEPEKQDEADRDILLSQEIDSLLCETKVPKLPDDLDEVVTATSSVSSDKIDCNRTLPPKERGKRIFKTRNKNSVESLISPSAEMDDSEMGKSQLVDVPEVPPVEGNKTPVDKKPSTEVPVESQHEENMDKDVAPTEPTSKDRQKSIEREKDDGSGGGRGRRFENSDFATIKSKRTKYARKEQEEENQIPSVTSSEAGRSASAAAVADVEDVQETHEKKRKEDVATVVTTTDPELANTATSSLVVKNSSTKGRRGKQKKTPTPKTDLLPVESQESTEEKKMNNREQKVNRSSVEIEAKAPNDVVTDVVDTVSAAKKKRKSSEPHLPDSSGSVERSQQGTERKRGRKRKEASPIAESSDTAGNHSVEESDARNVQKTIVTEEDTSVSIPTKLAVKGVSSASHVVGTAQSIPTSITSKSINPRKRHLHSMLQSSDAVSTAKRGEAKVSTAVDISTVMVPAPVSTAPEHETPSIPEKRKRDTSAGSSASSEPSTTEGTVPQQALPPTKTEDDKFDIDSMPIVIGDNNGILVNEVVTMEQPKSLPDASPSSITVMKSVNGGNNGGGSGATPSSSSKVMGGLLSKTMKEKRPTTVTMLKGGSSGQEQIVITSKGTVLTTSSSSISVNSKLSSKSTVTVTSAITIGTGGRNVCSTSAATTTGLVRRLSNPLEQPESSSNGPIGQQTIQTKQAEGANSIASTKAHVAAPTPSSSSSSSSSTSTSTSSSSSSSSAALSSSPKKAITKKLLHGNTTMSSLTSSNSSSNKLLPETVVEASRELASAGDGASSSVSSSSSGSSPHAGGSGGAGGSIAEGGKKNTRVLRLTPQKLKEFSRLGYIEDRGHGKVLTPSGMRKLKQELHHQQQQQQQQEETQGKKKTKTTLATKTIIANVGTASCSSSARKSVAEVASSGNVVVAAAADSSVQESTGSIEELAVEGHVEPGSAVIISKAENIPAVSAVEVSGVSAVAAAAVLIESSPSSSGTEVILGTTELATEASSSNGAGAGGGNGASGVQDPQLIAVPAENFGGPPNLFYLCSVREESLVPVNNELLYLDSSNQLVALPEQQQQQPHSVQHQPSQAASAEDIINQAEVIIPSGNNGAEVAVGSTVAVATVGASEAGSMVDAAAADGTQQSFLLNTQDGQQIILDQQSLMALAAGGDTPHLLTADGQQILLQETAQEWLAALSASQPGGQLQPGGGSLGTLVTPEGTQIILAHEHAGLIELHEHPVLLPTDIIQVNPNTTIETNAVLTKPPIMSTVEAPTKNGIEATSSAGRVERKGISASASGRAEGGSPSGASTDALLRGTTNLDESLAAVIGHVPSNPHVPTSLELPITVTNPAIAKTTTTSSRLNPPLFPVTTIATTVPSPSDVLSSAATVVLIAADQATVAVAGTIDQVPSPSSPPPSSSPSASPLLALKGQPTWDESIERERRMLATEKTRKLSFREEPKEEEDVDDIQIPNTPESQQNSNQQMEYSFSDNEGADDPESNDHSVTEAQQGIVVAPECPDTEDGNSNCSEVIALQPNVVILDDDMIANNVEDDGIDEEMDNENESDEGDAERHQATVRHAAGSSNVGQQNRNANGSTGGQSDANVPERHQSNNNDSGIDTNMHAPVNEAHDGYAAERVARRAIVER